MTALQLPRYLAASVLGLALAISPSPANAGGPQPKPDFTIQTHEKVDVWGYGEDYGTWAMSGVARDSGTMGLSISFPLSKLWLYGDQGWMYIETYGGDRTFQVIDGTGAYESWVGATGTYTISYGREDHNGYRAVKRRLEGFLPIAP